MIQHPSRSGAGTEPLVQTSAELIQAWARRGGAVLVHGPNESWRRARLPPRRGSGAYLEILPSGELRLWCNDGNGGFRTLRQPQPGRPQTPKPGPGGYLRRYAAGRSALQPALQVRYDD